MEKMSFSDLAGIVIRSVRVIKHALLAIRYKAKEMLRKEQAPNVPTLRR